MDLFFIYVQNRSCFIKKFEITCGSRTKTWFHLTFATNKLKMYSVYLLNLQYLHKSSLWKHYQNWKQDIVGHNGDNYVNRYFYKFIINVTFLEEEKCWQHNYEFQAYESICSQTHINIVINELKYCKIKQVLHTK